MGGESEHDVSSTSVPDWVSFDDEGEEGPPAAPAPATCGVSSGSATSAGLLPPPPEHAFGSLSYSATTIDGSAYMAKMQRRLDLLKQPGNVSTATRVRPRTARALRSQSAFGTIDDYDDFNPRSQSGDDTFTGLADSGEGVSDSLSLCCCCWPWARVSYAAADTARTDALSEMDDLMPKAPETKSQEDDSEMQLDSHYDQPYVQLLNESKDGDGESGGLALSDDWIEPAPEPEPEPQSEPEPY